MPLPSTALAKAWPDKVLTLGLMPCPGRGRCMLQLRGQSKSQSTRPSPPGKPITQPNTAVAMPPAHDDDSLLLALEEVRGPGAHRSGGASLWSSL